MALMANSSDVLAVRLSQDDRGSETVNLQTGIPTPSALPFFATAIPRIFLWGNLDVLCHL